MISKKKFYEMARHERLHYLKKITALSKRDIAIIQDPLLAFNFDDANRMIENAIGMLMLPLGIATDFMVNSKNIPRSNGHRRTVGDCSGKQSDQNCKKKWRFYSRGR